MDMRITHLSYAHDLAAAARGLLALHCVAAWGLRSAQPYPGVTVKQAEFVWKNADLHGFLMRFVWENNENWDIYGKIGSISAFHEIYWDILGVSVKNGGFVS